KGPEKTTPGAALPFRRCGSPGAGLALELERFLLTDSESVPDGQAGLSLVQGIEMQARGASGQQLFTHVGHHIGTELEDAVAVITIGLQLLADPAGQFCTTGFGE